MHFSYFIPYVTAIFCLLMVFPTVGHAQLADSIFGSPNLLLGKTAVASGADVNTVQINPALGAFSNRHQIGVLAGIERTSFAYQYPGAETQTTSEFGLSPAIPLPYFLFRLNRRFTVSGIFLISPELDIEAPNITLVILGQPSKVDIIGKAQLNYYGKSELSFRLNRHLALGVQTTLNSLRADIGLLSSGSTDNALAELSIQSSELQMALGVAFKSSVIDFGIVADLIANNTTKTEAIGGILSPDPNSPIQDSENQEELGGEESSSIFLRRIRVGLGLQFNRTLKVFGDLAYMRNNPDQERFSIVALGNKPLETHPTLSAFLGARVSYRPTMDLLGGFFYEPSAIGPGNKEDTGKTGFGFFDLALAQGKPPSKPAMGGGIGVEYRFMPQQISENRLFYRSSLQTGMVFSATSFGVDSTGEQPGAYGVNRITFPAQFVYRF